MEPRIETIGEIRIVGLEYVGQNENMEVPAVWDQFFPRAGEITNGVNDGVYYGYMSMVDVSATGEFSYVAGREVSSLEDVPEGLVGRTIPGGTYAVFTHVGPLDELDATFNYIYQSWLPTAPYDAGPYTFEYYDDRFHDFALNSEMDIYVPVKPKG